ncbi:MAG: ABC transporter ATP-binding protein [Nitrospirae bacterium]|nr:ABC transporter ATP-binding protein [Magnetococcales bacterium]
MLQVTDISSGYSCKQVLNNVSLTVNKSEIVAIIGHNGAGKSTLLKTIFGLLPLTSGKISFCGIPLGDQNPRRLIQCGAAFIPQGHPVFSELTVWENLKLGSLGLESPALQHKRIHEVLTQIPELAGRLQQQAGTLSGGEKQKLALAVVQIRSPNLILMDEPSLGLSPAATTHAFERISSLSRDQGVSILVVEQKVREVLKIAQQVYVLRNGKVVFHGTPKDIDDDRKLYSIFL